MVNTFFSLSFTSLRKSYVFWVFFFNFPSESVTNTVSQANPILLKSCLLTVNPSCFFNSLAVCGGGVISLDRLYKSGDKTLVSLSSPLNAGLFHVHGVLGCY